MKETPTILHNPSRLCEPNPVSQQGQNTSIFVVFPSLSQDHWVWTECLQLLSSNPLIKDLLADKCLDFPWDIICFQNQTSARCSVSWLFPCVNQSSGCYEAKVVGG